jgi:hypothetical protein
MSPISVGRLEPYSQWDQNMLDQLFVNKLYPTGLEFSRTDHYPDSEGCVLLIPGQYWVDQVEEISRSLQRYSWVLAMRTGDEHDSFDITRVSHPNIKWWVQTPRADRSYGEARRFGVGFTPHFNDLPADPPDKDLPVFLAGQNNHDRRRQAFSMIAQIEGSVSFPTQGFTQGMSPEMYRDHMLRTRVAPAPAGVFSPDSFRVYEALEAHAVPIADDISPVPAYDSQGYWHQTLGAPPLPILTDYQNLPGWVRDVLDSWPGNANRIVSLWMKLKRTYARWLVEDLSDLGAF